MISCDWSTMSDELLLRIFRYLPVRVLARVQRVCKHWARISQDKTLWTPHHRSVRSMRHWREPTKGLSVPITVGVRDSYDIAYNHVAYIFAGCANVVKIDAPEEYAIPLPFVPEDTHFLRSDRVVFFGSRDFAIVRLTDYQVTCYPLEGEVTFFGSHCFLVTLEVAEGVREYDGSKVVDLRGECQQIFASERFVSVVMKNGPETELTLCDRTLKRCCCSIKKPQCRESWILEGGYMVADCEEGVTLVYNTTTSRQHLCKGHYIDGDGQQGILLCYDRNHLIVYELCTGKALHRLDRIQGISEAMLCGQQRLLLHRLGRLEIWDMRTQEAFFEEQLTAEELRVNIKDHKPKFDSNIVVLRKGADLIFVDTQEGSIQHRLRAHGLQSQICFFGDRLHECVLGKGRMTIITYT